jgi:hypothetical protein
MAVWRPEAKAFESYIKQLGNVHTPLGKSKKTETFALPQINNLYHTKLGINRISKWLCRNSLMWTRSRVQINTRHFPNIRFLNYLCLCLLGILDVGVDFLWYCDLQKWCFYVCRESDSECTCLGYGPLAKQRTRGTYGPLAFFLPPRLLPLYRCSQQRRVNDLWAEFSH